MSGEAVVPGDARLLVLRSHGRYVAGVEEAEEGPDLLHGLQEEDVGVDVQQRVHVLQNQLIDNSKKRITKSYSV